MEWSSPSGYFVLRWDGLTGHRVGDTVIVLHLSPQLIRLVPIEALGACRPGDILCGAAWCLVSGEWHIGWQVPLNDLWRSLGLPVQFPPYMLTVFVLPLLYGAWRFVAFHAVAGPVAAMWLTDNPHEMPAIWCLFSIGLLLIALSPFVRVKLFKAHQPVTA